MYNNSQLEADIGKQRSYTHCDTHGLQLLGICRPNAVFLLAMAFSISVFYTPQGQSQTLNAVVNQQLEVGPNRIACEALLGNDPASVLVGPLAGRELCGRRVAQAAEVASAATGGGAATTTSLPMIVQKRLKKDGGKDAGGGASADAVSELGNGWNVFVSGGYQSLDRNLTTFEDGYNSNIWNATGGVDKQVTEQLLAGLAFNYAHQDGDFASAGDFSNSSYGGLAYVSYTPLENLFIQMNAGYSFRDYERKRMATFTEINPRTGVARANVADFVSGKYAGQDYSAGILAGYDMSFDSLTIGPRAGFNWVRNDYNSYNERGNSGLELHFNTDHRTSLQSSFGAFASYSISTGFGVIVPQAGVDWIHEFDNDQRDIRFSFVGDTRGKTFTFQNEKPDRDFVEVNAGTVFVLPHGIQAYANYRALAGHSYYNGHTGSIGVRLAF